MKRMKTKMKKKINVFTPGPAETLQEEIWKTLSEHEKNYSGIKGSDNPPYRNLEEGWCLRWLLGRESIINFHITKGKYPRIFCTIKIGAGDEMLSTNIVPDGLLVALLTMVVEVRKKEAE